MNEDVIVAPITATGGAVALVRLSGPGAWRVASKVFQPWHPQPRHAAYGKFVHGDDGLAVPFPTGSSYTGEESVEFSVHGSPASVRLLVEACIQKGARMAQPGEFSLRAFMNGRIDLAQAEGVRASVEALSDAQLRQGQLLREGELTAEVSRISAQVVQALAAVEAATDFEEETGPLDRHHWGTHLQFTVQRVKNLAAQANNARLVREGLTVAIVGQPNAGKSSLFNALCSSDRAIVTANPGTTRDLVEAEFEHRGHLIRLIDTAGLREAEDEAEQIGVERSLFAQRNADLVLYCFDASVGWTEEDARRCPESAIQVATKTDLAPAPPGTVGVSSKTRAGLAQLLERFEVAGLGSAQRPGLVLPRHHTLLNQTAEALTEARETLEQGAPTDLAAVHLQSALRLLGEITGETASADVLEKVFSQFCIGK